MTSHSTLSRPPGSINPGVHSADEQSIEFTHAPPTRTRPSRSAHLSRHGRHQKDAGLAARPLHVPRRHGCSVTRKRRRAAAGGPAASVLAPGGPRRRRSCHVARCAPFVASQTHAHQLTPSSGLVAALLELADANGLQRGVATYPECESVEMFMFNYPQARRGPRLLAAKRRGVDLAASPCPPDARAARFSVAAPPVCVAAGAVAATRPGSLPAARGAPLMLTRGLSRPSDASSSLLRRVCGLRSAR